MPTKPMRFLRLPEVCKKTGLGKSLVYELASLGRFPRPVKVAGASRWVESEVESAMARFIAERDAGVARPTRGRAA